MMTQQTKSNERPWDWTPPKGVNRMMSTVLRLPLVHSVMSKSLMLISFTGKKSGKQYTTPVGYYRDGKRILIVTKRFRAWWQNFVAPAPVTLRLQGRDVAGTALSIADEATIIPLMTQIAEGAPQQAEIFHIEMVDGKPAADSVRQIAPKIVIIEVTLA